MVHTKNKYGENLLLLTRVINWMFLDKFYLFGILLDMYIACWLHFGGMSKQIKLFSKRLTDDLNKEELDLVYVYERIKSAKKCNASMFYFNLSPQHNYTKVHVTYL